MSARSFIDTNILLYADSTQDRIELFARFEIVTASVGALKAALALRSIHRMSFRDALILQAAHDAGCTVLLSEDLATGATLAGVTIADPFGAPLPARAAARRRRKPK